MLFMKYGHVFVVRLKILNQLRTYCYHSRGRTHVGESAIDSLLTAIQYVNQQLQCEGN